MRNLTVPQIVIGTSTTKLMGELSSNTIVPAGQSVLIKFNGLTRSATVGADGRFSASFATAALGIGIYVISYRYNGNNNFTAVSGSASLIVAYGTRVLSSNGHISKSRAALPIELTLTDSSGANISSPSIAVTAVGLVDVRGNPVSLQAAGHGYPSNLFRYDPASRSYILFNLDTAALTTGTYTLYFMVGKDPTKHSMTLVVD